MSAGNKSEFQEILSEAFAIIHDLADADLEHAPDCVSDKALELQDRAEKFISRMEA